MSQHSLLFLLIAGLSLDLVLNNFEETTSTKEAWYGVVICVDFVTWILTAAVMTLNQPGPGEDFTESLIVLVIPIAAFLREIVFMPALFDYDPATVDLMVLAIVMIAWILLPSDISQQKEYHHTAVAAKVALLIGLVYWSLMTTENIFSHLLGLDHEIKSVKAWFGNGFRLNMAYLLLAMVTGVALYGANPNDLRSRFGGPCTGVSNQWC